jgi:hypothetical protein
VERDSLQRFRPGLAVSEPLQAAVNEPAALARAEGSETLRCPHKVLGETPTPQYDLVLNGLFDEGVLGGAVTCGYLAYQFAQARVTQTERKGACWLCQLASFVLVRLMSKIPCDIIIVYQCRGRKTPGEAEPMVRGALSSSEHHGWFYAYLELG